MDGETMRYLLSDVHIEAAKTLLEKEGPCSLFHLAGRLQEQSICPDLDKIYFIQQLRELSEQNVLDSSKIEKAKLLRGLTAQQKLLIKELAEGAVRDQEFLTFDQIAEKIVEQTGGKIEEVKRQILFLFVPLHSSGDSDDETPSEG